jgi:L-erythro-3,5-diaminohexanoate dehydrogenase
VTASLAEQAARLGADRVLEPLRSLPQPALRLDASGPLRPFEIEIAIDRLCLDSTSHRNIRERSDGDPARMAARILEIVAERGKMHNPETDSGGVALGTVTAVGDRRVDRPTVGQRVVTLCSNTLLPLTLDAVVRVDPRDPQVEVAGTAYLAGTAAWAPVPDDIPEATAVELYDVYSAGSHTPDLGPREGGTVLVLGAGHAGRLACAAARDSSPSTMVAVVDVDEAAALAIRDAGLADVALAADLRDPVGALGLLRGAGVEAAELTVVVVNARNCEAAAILATKPTGTILFFSMATGFSTAALTADGVTSTVTMIVGNGYAEDRGAYALDLYRRDERFRGAVERAHGHA